MIVSTFDVFVLNIAERGALDDFLDVGFETIGVYEQLKDTAKLLYKMDKTWSHGADERKKLILTNLSAPSNEEIGIRVRIIGLGLGLGTL